MALPLAQQQPDSAHWFVDDDGRRHALSFNGFVWFMPPRPTCRGEFVASLDYLRRNLRKHPLRGGEASTFRTVPDRQDVLERLRTIEPQLRRLGMKELWLFGSVARGDADFDSDGLGRVDGLGPSSRRRLLRRLAGGHAGIAPAGRHGGVAFQGKVGKVGPVCGRTSCAGVLMDSPRDLVNDALDSIERIERRLAGVDAHALSRRCPPTR